MSIFFGGWGLKDQGLSGLPECGSSPDDAVVGFIPSSLLPDVRAVAASVNLSLVPVWVRCPPPREEPTAVGLFLPIGCLLQKPTSFCFPSLPSPV